MVACSVRLLPCNGLPFVAFTDVRPRKTGIMIARLSIRTHVTDAIITSHVQLGGNKPANSAL
jgi:hypothetical protein